ncbi:hypothetical protein A2W24_04115 [Microgenomates group bacterium RBG_16_45_19]|nr:MAG: hypothetical protein A2W24_04115 [Microgenomates group bacterium RBG_16_45_19]
MWIFLLMLSGWWPVRVWAQTPTPLVPQSLCQGITLSPEKPAYSPGETVTINVSTAGEVNNIGVRYIQATRNIVREPFVSQGIQGSFDANTQSWQGSWTVPANGEYLLMVNIYQPDGYVCAGNPGYLCPGCEQGVLAGGGQASTVYTTACQGCHKNVVVNDRYGLTSPDDLKEYMQYEPGHSWLFRGTTKYCGGEQRTICPGETRTEFMTRVTAEEKVNICGYILQPVRFYKDKIEGYILPNTATNFRKLLTYFDDSDIYEGVDEKEERWSNLTVGKVINKHYLWEAQAVNKLGTLGWETNDDYYVSVNRHLTDDGLRAFDLNYHAPHVFGQRYVVDGQKMQFIDTFYPNYFNDTNGDGQISYGDTNGDGYITWKDEGNELCDWFYRGNSDPETGHGTERFFGQQVTFEPQVTTPAYQGSAIRLTLIEAGMPKAASLSAAINFEGTDRWHIREDWIFAKGIGRVKLLERDCHVYNSSGAIIGTHSDCLKDSQGNYPVMSEPNLEMNLVNYYLSGPLALALTSGQTATAGGVVALSLTSQTGPYTGWLEIKDCLGSGCTPANQRVWYNTWVQAGRNSFTLDQNLPPGPYRLVVRPLVERVPEYYAEFKNSEMVVTNTNLPWSNEVVIQVGLDLTGDEVLDIRDVWRVIAGYGEEDLPADINGSGLVDVFDFNAVVQALY